MTESQLYNRAKLLNFPAFYVLLSYIHICHTQKDKLTTHDLLWADWRIKLWAQEHKSRWQSWLHFPGSPLRKEGPAYSPLWAGRGWEMVLSTLSLVHTSVQRGIIVTTHHCPPRATLWDPVPGVSAMVCVPKSLCELPPCSALHHSPHKLFTHQHPALFKVQDRRLGSRTSQLLPSAPAAPSKPFWCFMPLSPCKAGGYLLYFHTNRWIYGSKLRAGHQWNGVSAASHLQHSHSVHSRKPNTLQKLSIPRSLPNTHIEFGTTETATSLHITGMLFVSKGFI